MRRAVFVLAWALGRAGESLRAPALTSVLICAMCSGCLWVYSPSRVAVPLAANQREITVAGGYSSMGVEASAFVASEPRELRRNAYGWLAGASATVSPTREGMTSDYEAALGAAWHFERFERLRLENLLVGGAGRVCDCRESDESVRGGFGFVGTQSAVAFDSRWVALGAALRTTWHTMPSLRVLEPGATTSVDGNYRGVFIEPVGVLRVGPRWLRGELQVGYSAEVARSSSHDFDVDNGQATLSLVSSIPF